MWRFLLCAVAVSALWLTGCSSPRSSGSPAGPEPVNFNHPDEINQAGGYMALADRRIFAAMAFVNAVGYDREAQGCVMHPVRVKVRQELAKRLADKPEKLKAYRTYYQEVIVKGVPMFAYKSYVLALSADYPFRRIEPDQKLAYAYTARALRDLPRMLNDFWTTAGLDSLWEQVKPDYVAAIREYDVDKMQREMTFLWEYFRMPRRDSSTIIVQVPDLLDRHTGAMGAGYGPYSYSVNNPGSSGNGLNVHEYLHSIINPLVEANYARFRAKLRAYYEAGKDTPVVRGSYGHPVTFAFECLVGACDRRIMMKFENDPKWTRLAQQQVAGDTQAGLNLTQPYYNLLPEFEQSGKSFDEFLPTLLEHLPEYRP
jgi:hypothetical protein